MKAVIVKNWLTRRKNAYSAPVSASLFILLYGSSVLFFTDLFSARSWMPATPNQVLEHKEYWRLWTTLFAHADMGHLLANSLLFFPFSYFLMNYFSPWFFPMTGLAVGGVTNYLVLQTMPPSVSLIGISGVVYWLGAAWITLFLLIDHREKWRRKFGHVLFLSLMLFIPDTIQPEVSYLSHFIGFVLGVICAVIYYKINRAKFENAVVIHYHDDPADHEEWRLDYLPPEENPLHKREA